MDLNYKSSQYTTNFFRVKYDRIPIEEINENTDNLLKFIDEIDLSDESINENINEYEETIANLLSFGAKCTVITRNNVLSILTEYNNKFLDEIGRSGGHFGNTFDPFLHLLFELSKSNNENNILICANNSKFQEFLVTILLNIKEFNILNKAIKIVYNLIFERPKLVKIFDDKLEIIIKCLYYKYDNYFSMNSNCDFIDEQDQNTIIQELIIPSFELALIFLIYNESNSINEYALRIVVTIENILEKKRSNENLGIYLFQLRMVLSQLNYILAHSYKSNSDYIEYFSTFLIIQEIVNLAEVGYDITTSALECLKEYAKTFSGAYLILKKEEFCNYRPDPSNFKDEVQYIESIKLYCQTWANAINSILNKQVPNKGRVQSAKIIIQSNANSLLEYLKSINEIRSDFEYQKSVLIPVITMANYNDDNILNLIVSQFQDIIEKTVYVLDEGNPNEILQISACFTNILDHYIKNGSSIDQIKSDLLVNEQFIIKGLNETKEMYDNANESQIMKINENINHIEEVLGKILQDEDQF